MKFSKIMFINSLFLSTLLSISSFSWFSMWMGLEINLLSMIPLMVSKNNSMSSEAAMKYFISQTMASTVILMSILTMYMKINIPFIQSNILDSILNSMIMLKMGAAPLHFWFPEVIEGISWMNSLLLLTWQKITPFIILMNNNPEIHLMEIFTISSALIGSVMSFNQTSIRKIMAFSSINHMSWMLMSSMNSVYNWSLYFMIYSILSSLICLMMKKENLFFSSQIYNMDKKKKYTLLINFLSMGGIPPFIGFLPKWMVINKIIQQNFNFMAFISIISSIILLFVYMRMFFTSMLLSQEKKKIKITKMNQTFIITSSILINSSMIVFSISLNLN